MSDQTLSPFYMWAGGKSKLIKHYEDLWPKTNAKVPYVEPFFGGGAIFCWMENLYPGVSSYIGDTNFELMGLLEAIKTDYDGFIKDVSKIAKEYLKIEGKENRKVWYYRLRKKYWINPKPSTLYILMKLGFNGIWQTCLDSHGLFGTPAGLLNQDSLKQIVNPELLLAWSKALQTTRIHAGSYETLVLPKKPSLIYLDPPYRDSFTSYSTGFSDKDQLILIAWYRKQVSAGHKVILANRCVEGDDFFEKLISDIADFHYFDVTYTAGRRKKEEEGYSAKKAREFIAISKK